MSQIDGINNQYNLALNSQTQQLANKYNALKDTTNNQINQSTSQLGTTTQSYNNTLKDLNNQQTTDTNTQNQAKNVGDAGYYEQKNTVAQTNAQQGNRIQDWMASHNLQQSGENVDAQLHNTTDLNNGISGANASQNTFDTGIASKIADLLSMYGGKKATAQTQEQGALDTINNDIQGYRSKLAGYGTGQANDLQALQNQNNSDRQGAINSYNQQVQAQEAQRALAQQAQAAAAANEAANRSNQLQIAQMNNQRIASAARSSGPTYAQQQASSKANATAQQNQVDKAAVANFGSMDNSTDMYTLLHNQSFVNDVSPSVYSSLMSKYQNTLKSSGGSESFDYASQPTYDYANQGTINYGRSR